MASHRTDHADHRDEQIQERPRKAWVCPEVRDLPKLTDLTLLTGSPIPGTGGSGGSSVF